MKRSSAVVAALFVALMVLAGARADSPQAPPDETSGAQGTPAPSGRPGAASATETPARPSPLGTRVFNLRYKKVDEAYLLISPYVGPRGSVKM